MKNKFLSKSVPRGTRTIWRYLGALFILFTFAIGQMWGANYTPTADEVIILSDDAYDATATTAGYSKHSAITWAGAPSFSDKTCGDPTKALGETTSSLSAVSVKGNGGGKNLTLSIAGCSKFIVYHEKNANRHIVAEITPDGEAKEADQTGSNNSAYTEITLDGTKSYSVFVYSYDDSDKKKGKQDLYVYAIKLIKAASGGDDPVAVTGITIAPASATIKVGKTVTLVPTITPSNATDKAVTWAVTSGSSYASVTDAGVVTGLAAGTAVVTATAHDGSSVKQTATITVEECPTSGTVFSMDITASEGTAYTGNNTFPALIDATYVGGKAYSGSKSGTNRTSTIDSNGEYPFSANSELAIKVVMDCDLAEGDIIDITTSSTRQIKIQKVAGTDLYKTANKTFTIPSGSSLIGENVFYLLRDNSESTLGSLTVTRPIYRTITLKYNDGVTPDGSLQVIDGTAATKPADPTRGKYTFLGWFVGDTDDEYVWSSTVNSNITLKAHWQDPWTITFNSDGGSEVASISVKHNTKAEKPTDPTKASNEFGGWFIGDTDNEFDWDANVTANYSLKAHWLPIVAKYDIEYYDGATKIGTEEQVRVDQHPAAAGINTKKPLYTFVGWYTSSTLEGDPVDLNTVTPVEGLKFYGKWNKAYAANIDFEAFIDANTTDGDWSAELADKHYAISSTTGVTLDAPNGKPADKGLKIKNSGSYLSFNVHAGKLVLLKAGVLSGAQASVDGGANYSTLIGATGSTAASVVTPLYNAAEAEYRIRTTTGSYNIIQSITIQDPYQVTFDANGGEDVASLNGTPSVTLPLPTKETDSFLGWFDGETKVGEAGDTYTPTANITLVAHWEAVSTDARLASISFSSDAGTLSLAFDPEVTSYTYTMPYGTAAIPTITGATSVNANAQAPIIGDAATAWGEAQTIQGVAQSGDKKTYTITMVKAPKDGVCIIKGNVGNNTFVIDEDASLFAGTADKNNVRENSSTYQEKTGWKFQARPARLGLTLSGDETFQEGDVVEVFVTSVADIQGNNDKMRIFDATDATAAHVLYESEADMIQGANRFVLPATTTKSLYLHRTKDADYDNFNPYVACVAVYRPMNPVLTAIQFNETDVEVTSTAVAATLPNGTNLSTMTVTPTIVWNGAGTAAPTAAWAWGANTYRVTDKDGDYTDYTITLTEAVPAVDPTLTYNEGAYMVGTSALDLSTLIDAADSDGEITYTVKDAGATGATITDGKFTATAAGTATITATQAATVAYNAKTVDFNVVVTVATEIDGIKMVENNALTGNFRVKADQLKTGAYTVEGINYAKYVQMGSTHTSFSGEAEGTQAKGIYYAPTKKNITFWFYMQNTESSTTRKIYVYTIEEGKAITSKTVDVEAGSHLVSTDITLTTNAEIVFGVENTKLCFCQIVAVESGEDLLQGGQNGYVFDYSKKRQNVAQNVVRTIDGIDYKLSAESKINSASNVQLTTLGTHYIKFHLDAPMTVNVYADNKKYYVGTECSTEDAAMTYEATGDGEFTLAAGNWYINGSGAQVKINKLAFSLPKCEKPTITAQPQTKQTFDPGNNLTATVEADAPSDGGTLKYQWYNAANDEEVEGATSATLTTTTKGTYYVIVTNTLAGHQDNSTKSDEAELGYRVTDDATLSVLKYGETTIALEDGVYEYDVNLAKGTTEVPALAATATMNGYATVTISNAAEFVSYAATSTVTVKSEDLTVTNVYTVNFYVKYDLPQVDVTGSTVWDMTNVSASEINLASFDPSKQNERLLLANIDGVNNNASFNSQALMFEGQRIGRTENNVKHISGQYVQFNVTVPGMVSVTFASNGSAQRTIQINGKECSRTTTSSDYIRYDVAVEPGSVEIEDVQGYVRISKIEFKAGDNYHRTVNPSYLGTLCWTNNAVLGGATLYEFAGKNEYNYLVFDEVAENRLEAGKPYIFMPENGNTLIKVYNTDDVAALTQDQEPVNHMYGTITGKTLVPGQDDEMYYFSASHIWAVKDFVVNINVPAYYCYVDYDAVLAAEPAPAPAPGRRRVTMGVQGQQVATGIEDVQGDNVQCTKMLINGQLFILRGEKMYDAKGQLVK